MARLRGWEMFFEIMNQKKLGFNKSQTTRHLGIDYETVSKYWEMSASEYAEMLKERSRRVKKLDKYKDEIVSWLRDYSDMSAAQIEDWLIERYKLDDCSDRSIRGYVNNLREEYKIPKIKQQRQYEAVDELPMGYQAQVDFGQIWLTNENGQKTKLYCFTMVLSHSRQKYAYWMDRPFTVTDFIEAHNKAFEYFGGRTIEIVYDQDRLLAVDENYGDIMFTEEFQKYIEMVRFKVYLCRSHDPESKGKIEAVVKYIKYNFAIHRAFTDIDTFNEECLRWLDRTGNAKKHGTTRKIPKAVFALEKEHLLPVALSINKNTRNNSLSYVVRKDNTVMYKQNRYEVPKGTYSPGKQVEIVFEDDMLLIVDKASSITLAKHRLSNMQGKLIRIPRPDRDITTKFKDMYEDTLKLLDETDTAIEFLERVRKEKSRYIRDQLGLIKKTANGADKEIIQQALNYCCKRSLYSATYFKDTMLFMSDKVKQTNKDKTTKHPPIPSKYKDVIIQVRATKEYAEVLGGIKNEQA